MALYRSMVTVGPYVLCQKMVNNSTLTTEKKAKQNLQYFHTVTEQCACL